MAGAVPAVWGPGHAGEGAEEAPREQPEEGGPAGRQPAAERPPREGVQCRQLPAPQPGGPASPQREGKRTGAPLYTPTLHTLRHMTLTYIHLMI